MSKVMHTNTMDTKTVDDRSELKHTDSQHMEFSSSADAVNDLKVNDQGITLVPQPSDDPNDPLNWSQRKKLLTLVVISLAAFAGVLQSLANTAGFLYQAALYHKSAVQLSYGSSAGLAGLMCGPLIWIPLSKITGKCAALFWSIVMTLCMNIWSANMTGEDQYIPFIISRLLGGLTGSAGSSLGSEWILEMFFLHDRGKAMTLFQVSMMFGTIASSTLSGFIVQSVSWTVQFWYNVGIEGLVAVGIFLFVDETRWPRQPDDEPAVTFKSPIKRKLATYIFVTKIVRNPRLKLETVIRPIVLMFNPVFILVGLFVFIVFAWGVTANTFLSIYLQTPVIAGGYGFTAQQNACFTFAQWLGVLAVMPYGYFVFDRLPMLIARLSGGRWKPEYRLHALWIPGLVILPASLGLIGATLYNHYHWAVLAVAIFFSTFGMIAVSPPTTTYLIEAISPALASEITVGLNIYRFALAIGTTFFITPWEEAVGINWTYGIMAFLALPAFGLVVIAMFYGEKIRNKSTNKWALQENVVLHHSKGTA